MKNWKKLCGVEWVGNAIAGLKAAHAANHAEELEARRLGDEAVKGVKDKVNATHAAYAEEIVLARTACRAAIRAAKADKRMAITIARRNRDEALAGLLPLLKEARILRKQGIASARTVDRQVRALARYRAALECLYPTGQVNKKVRSAAESLGIPAEFAMA